MLRKVFPDTSCNHSCSGASDAALRPRPEQHSILTIMIPRLCAPVWLADSLATVVVLMRSAVFFMITHYSSLLRLAELEWTCSWPCLRLGV